jgi:predicted NUDIX family NTP pyrophosphohydrolase
MPTQPQVSAGVLLFRHRAGKLQVLIAHPGGPFWAKRDLGAWSIPKGLAHEDEDLLVAARREFMEETGLNMSGPFIPLGSIQQKAGKIVHAWACEGDADLSTLKSNRMRVEWPPKSGRHIWFPEVDRYAWYAPSTARRKLNPAQAEFVARLEVSLR